MIEKKKCVICNNDVFVINCHYKCDKCGIAENCHDIHRIIDLDESYFFLEYLYFLISKCKLIHES